VGRARTVVQRPTIHASAATHGAHASAQNAAAAEVLGYTRTSLTFTYRRARLRCTTRRTPLGSAAGRGTPTRRSVAAPLRVAASTKPWASSSIAPYAGSHACAQNHNGS
jgi:hypothetical protein